MVETTQWTVDDVNAWFRQQVPDGWFVELDGEADRDEIMLTGRIEPTDDGDDARSNEALAITAFREATREQRIDIASRAEAMWGRKVSWAVVCGETLRPFTTTSVPVMSRLRFDERRVLDTLIDAGVAKSRSDALGWCVRLVAKNEESWIARLRDVMTEVERVRAEGPD